MVTHLDPRVNVKVERFMQIINNSEQVCKGHNKPEILLVMAEGACLIIQGGFALM